MTRRQPMNQIVEWLGDWLTITVSSRLGLFRHWMRWLRLMIAMIVSVIHRTRWWHIGATTTTTAVTIRHSSRSIETTGMSLRRTTVSRWRVGGLSVVLPLTIPVTSVTFSISLVSLLVLLPVDPVARLFPLRNFRFTIVVIFLSRWADVLRPITNSLRFILWWCRSPIVVITPVRVSRTFPFTGWPIVSVSLFVSYPLGIRAFVHIAPVSWAITKWVRTIRSQSSAIRRISRSIIVSIIVPFRAAIFGTSLEQ